MSLKVDNLEVETQIVAPTATPSADGLMSATDKTKLDGVQAGATNTPLATTAPVDVDKSAASIGASTEAARADHKHSVATASAVTIDASTTNSEGTSSSLARADHTHSISTGAAVSQAPNQTNSAGTSNALARADHVHNIPTAAPTTPLSPSTTNSDGTGTSFARNDHTHQINTASTLDISTILPNASANAGTADNFARGDHTHAIATGNPVTQQPDQLNQEGVSNNFARADHVHNIPTGVPSTIGTANLQGTANAFARQDHIHDHGNQTNPNHHALATQTSHGFMSSTDKTFLDGVQAQLDGKQPLGNYITALTGDVIATGPGSVTATLSNTGVTAGSYTKADITVDSKGRITSVASGDDYRVKAELFEEFLSGLTGNGTLGSLGWQIASSGTNAAWANVNLVPDGNYFGAVSANTGTTSTGRTMAYLNLGGVLFGNGSVEFEARVRIPILANIIDDYDFYIGFFDQTAAGDAVDGVYFEYNFTVSGTNWLLKSSNNSIRTQVISTAPIVANIWQRLRIVVNATGTQANYYVNDTLVGTITTNIPTANGRVTGPAIKIEKTLGTTNRTAEIDYVRITNTFNTLR